MDLAQRFKNLAEYANIVLPDGREKALMMTELENSLHHGQTAVLRIGRDEWVPEAPHIRERP